MALHLLPLVKNVPTILTALGEITSSLRARKAAGEVLKIEERTRKLEDDLLQTSSALSDLARQVQTIAEELRLATVRNQTRTKSLTVLAWTAAIALIGSITSLAIVLASRPS